RRTIRRGLFALARPTAERAPMPSSSICWGSSASTMRFGPASSAARSASTWGGSSFGGELAKSRPALTQAPTRAMRPADPAGRTVGAEHRAFDDRPRLVVEGQRKRVVELPGHAATDVAQATYDRRGRR